MHSRQSRALNTGDAESVQRPLPNPHKLVLRIGLLDQETGPTFCLVKNISLEGVQVKPYGNLTRGAKVALRVGDEDPVPGIVAWVQDRLAGIVFEEVLAPQALLRVAQQLAVVRRRSGPRINTDLDASLRTGGRVYRVTLCDLSMQGARIRALRHVDFGGPTTLEVLGLPILKCYLRWEDEMEFGVSFEAALPMQIIANLLG